MAKDKADKGTGNLLKSSNARAQAAWKERQRAAGFVMKTVWVRKADFDAGQRTAEIGNSSADDCPPGFDRASWMLGYCEHLDKAAKSRADAEAKRKGAK